MLKVYKGAGMQTIRVTLEWMLPDCISELLLVQLTEFEIAVNSGGPKEGMRGMPITPFRHARNEQHEIKQAVVE